jgi:two-component system, response regulator PdtaR
MAKAKPEPAAASRQALIVEDDTLVGMGLRSNLEALGFKVVGQAADKDQATALFRQHKPDLILMDIQLNDTDGIQLSAQLLQERRCAIVIVSAYSDPELIARAVAAGVFAYLIKPVSRPALSAQIEVAMQRWHEQEQLLHDKHQLTATLETRKLVDRAKGILMKKLKLDEPEAHKWLQTESQKRRITLAEISKRVIES